MSYKEFKAEYSRIQNLSKIEDPEPWLEYPPLIEEMLEVINGYEEAIKWYKNVGTVYWWTKEPDDIYVDEEDIVKENDTCFLSLIGSTQLTLDQVKHISQFMYNDINTDKYDYFFQSYSK